MSQPQRRALGLLMTGALYLGATGTWSCRAFPQQVVRLETIDALVERGLATRHTYAGLHMIERQLAQITPAGMAAYRGVPLATSKPPPVAAETVMRDVEQAMALLDRDIAALHAQNMRDSAAVRETRRSVARIEATITATEANIAKREAARDALERTRISLQVLVAHAAERLAETVSEARS